MKRIYLDRETSESASSSERGDFHSEFTGRESDMTVGVRRRSPLTVGPYQRPYLSDTSRGRAGIRKGLRRTPTSSHPSRPSLTGRWRIIIARSLRRNRFCSERCPRSLTLLVQVLPSGRRTYIGTCEIDSYLLVRRPRVSLRRTSPHSSARRR